MLSGRAGISPEMALRLERWLGVDHGGRASVWLGMQSAQGEDQDGRPEVLDDMGAVRIRGARPPRSLDRIFRVTATQDQGKP